MLWSHSEMKGLYLEHPELRCWMSPKGSGQQQCTKSLLQEQAGRAQLGLAAALKLFGKPLPRLERSLSSPAFKCLSFSVQAVLGNHTSSELSIKTTQFPHHSLKVAVPSEALDMFVSLC